MTLKIEQIVDLRKKAVPLVTIYGDSENYAFTRLIWSLIPGYDVVVATPKTYDDLILNAYNSALVFIIVGAAGNEGETTEIAKILAETDGVVADVIAITEQPDIRSRLHLLSTRFDAIYNLQIVGEEEFRKIFVHKISKGIMRLNAREQEDEYKAFLGFLSVSKNAFIVFDKYRRIFYVSPQYKDLFPAYQDVFIRGNHAKNVFEAMVTGIEINHPDGSFDNLNNKTVNGPHYQTIFDFWNNLTGTLEIKLDSGIHLRLTANCLPNEDGILVSVTDITSYKAQEELLEQNQQELTRLLAAEQEAGSLQKQFISMVSHEFRNPLAIIDGNAQIIEKFGTNLPEIEMKKRVKTMRAAVSRTVGMMETLLSSNLLKTGKLDLNRECFNLPQLVHDICEEQINMSHNIGHEKENQKILVEDYLTRATHDRDNHANVNLDKKFMAIILTNLISNAIKFTDPKTREIIVTLNYIDSFSCIGRSEQNGAIKITIKDNGLGIPECELPHIFERFYRASNANEISGSGVGLSLVRDLVNLHGGHVNILSQLNTGTTITIILPRG